MRNSFAFLQNIVGLDWGIPIINNPFFDAKKSNYQPLKTIIWKADSKMLLLNLNQFIFRSNEINTT
jgi:hypothetical protein